MSNKIASTSDNPIKTDILKIIAIVTMIIDHIGLFLYPQTMIFRIIGRISFPIFAYHIAVGYKNTSDVQKYLKRLFVFALISQIPYSISIGGFNIFFVLFLALLVIKFYEEKKNYKLSLVLIGVLILEGSLGFSYGLYGVFLPLVFHIYFSRPKIFLLIYIIMNIAYCLSRGQFYQLYSLMALPFIYYNWKIEISFNRYFYYGFYPVHLFVLFLVRKLSLL